jgi:hypothetical protein
LSISLERCRKISLASKFAIATGVCWIGLTLIQLVRFDPAGTLGALAAVIGGVVLLGSNSTTWSQLDAERHKAQAQRDELIGGLPLRVVGNESVTRH